MAARLGGGAGTWGCFGQAVRYWGAHKDNGIARIGYEFSPDDPFTGIDLDKCLDPKTGEIEPWAKANSASRSFPMICCIV